MLRLGDYKLELTPSITQPFLLTIGFPGGPISEFLKTLPSESRFNFNLVGEKADLATELPPLSLKVINDEALAHALNQVLASRGLVITPSSGASDGYSTRSIFVLKRIVDPDAGKPASEPRFRSYHVGDILLAKQSIDEITSAIHAAWEITPGSKPGQLILKYHPGTSLLLVTGPEPAIKTTENVLATLSAKSRIAAEAARFDMVAAEVRRRREARVAASDSIDPDLTVLPENAMIPAPRRASSAQTDPARLESPDERARRLEQITEEIRQRREARQASAAELEQRMEELRAETERRRAYRPRVEKSPPAPTMPPAPAATQ